MDKEEKDLNVSEELSTDIDAAVEADAKADSKGDEKVSSKKDGEESHQEESEKSEKDGEEKADKGELDDSVSSELTEKAIRAGLSLDDVKEFKSAKTLNHVLERLSEVNGDSGKSDKDKKPEDKKPEQEVDLLAAIPDLNPDEYDVKVVEGFKALKALVTQQQEVISNMKNADKKNEFENKLSEYGINKLVKDKPEKLTELKSQIDVLTAGLKATGKPVDADSVFKSAVSLVFGEVDVGRKADAVAKRQSQQINRPNRTNTNSTPDAFEETAADLDRKFFS